MIDLDSIEAIDNVDGEEVLAFGCDAESGQRRWAWIPVEAFYEAGRQDMLDAECFEGRLAA